MSNFLMEKDMTNLNKKRLFELEDDMQRLACQMVIVSCVSSRKV